MAQDNPSIISHVSLGTNDLNKAVSFYDQVMSSLGARQVMSFDGAVAYGKQFPEFWIQTPHDGGQAEPANGVHLAFIAKDKKQVHAFWETAIAAGAKPEGEPGPRPEYGEPYYGCFVRDLDGHKIEATYYPMPEE